MTSSTRPFRQAIGRGFLFPKGIPATRSGTERFSLAAFVQLVIAAFLGACSSSVESEVERPAQDWHFESDFDEARQLVDMFHADLSAWTNVQCVQPEGSQASMPVGLAVVCGANTIGLDTGRADSGPASLRMDASPTGASVSKAAIAKQGMDFRPGDRITARFRLYLEDNGSAENLFLMDFESTEKLGYPGRRLALSSGQELMLESKNTGGAFGSGPNFRQASAAKMPLPKGRWVSIRLELDLARDGQGGVKIWQDDVLVLEARGQTFPTEPEITRYDWMELGITANSSASSQRLWLDDVSLSRTGSR
jgi:hypothetical protein